VVTLAGKVASYQQLSLALALAQGVAGVTRVVNQLTIETGLQRSDVEIARDVETRLKWDALVSARLIRVEVQDGRVRSSSPGVAP
jgi:osmotically-inducible protein OsmY